MSKNKFPTKNHQFIDIFPLVGTSILPNEFFYLIPPYQDDLVHIGFSSVYYKPIKFDIPFLTIVLLKKKCNIVYWNYGIMIDDKIRGLPNKVDFQDIKTEKLIKIIKELGIDYSKRKFELLLKKYKYSTEDLIEFEYKNIVENFKDFKYFTILYSIMELRKRHFPNIPNMDWLEDLMQEGYTGIYENKNKIKGIEKWISAWELVKNLIPSRIKALEDADSFSNVLSQSIHNWCQDFEMELGNVAIYNIKYHHEMIKYTQEFISKFPESSSNIRLNMKVALANSLFSLGKYRKLNELFKEMYEEFPHEVWMYLKICFIFIKLAKKTGKIKYFDKAENLLEKANKIQNKNKHDKKGIMEYYEMLVEERQLINQKSSIIDEFDLAEQIMKNLPKYLPIETKLSKQTAKQLKKGMNLPHKYQIKSIVNSGEEGGIICDITFGKDPILVSITHLILEKSTPMYDVLLKYQKLRISNLGKLNLK